MNEEPRVFDLLRGDATETTSSPFGAVGVVHSGEGIEVVWVSKHAEQVDPDWFSTETVDLLLVVQGLLRVEFDDARSPELTLEPGQLLVLPGRTRCRAYRWPREAGQATIFLAAYPKAE
jgi:hypothetical protein